MSVHQDFKKTVIARLELIGENRKVSVGSEGEFTVNELIKHVKIEDGIGKKFIKIEIEFLQAMKEGLLT